MNQDKRLSSKRLILLVLCVAVAVLLCCVWIRTDSRLFSRDCFSLWNASALINGFAADSLWLGSMDAGTAGLVTTVIVVLAYIWVAFIFFELLQSFWSALSPNRRLRTGGFAVPAVFAVLAIVLPLILDSMGVEAVEAMDVTPIPYALAAVCLFALAVSFILDEERPAKAENLPDKLPEKAGETTEKKQALVSPKPLMREVAPPPAETKRTGNGLNVPYKTVGGVRVFAVAMYDARAKLRPVYLGLDREKSAVQLRLISYTKVKVSALRVDIQLITPFKETMTLKDIAFTELLERPVSFGSEYVSEFIRVNADQSFLRQVHELRVYLRSAVCDGRTYNMPENMSYIQSSVGPKELESLRSKYGADAMETPGSREDGWMCCCGRLSSPNESNCRICGRSKEICAPAAEAVVYCARCGSKLTSQQLFCYKCGTRAVR